MTFSSWAFSRPSLSGYTIPGSHQIKRICSPPPLIKQYEQARIVSAASLQITTGKGLWVKEPSLRLPKKAFLLSFWYFVLTSTPTGPCCLGLLVPLSAWCSDTPTGNEDLRPKFLTSFAGTTPGSSERTREPRTSSQIPLSPSGLMGSQV